MGNPSGFPTNKTFSFHQKYSFFHCFILLYISLHSLSKITIKPSLKKMHVAGVLPGDGLYVMFIWRPCWLFVVCMSGGPFSTSYLTNNITQPVYGAGPYHIKQDQSLKGHRHEFFKIYFYCEFIKKMQIYVDYKRKKYGKCIILEKSQPQYS